MSGNAAEWVADWLEPYTGDSLTDPLGLFSGTERSDPWRKPGK